MEILLTVADSSLLGISSILVVVVVFLFVDKGVLAFGGNVSGSVALETKVIVKAPLVFFWCEFFDMDGVYIHGIGVFFGCMFLVVVVSVILKGEEWVASSFGDLVGLFPDMFEVECLQVPFFYSVRDSVHGINSFH